MSVDVTTEIEIERACDDVARYTMDPDNAPEWYENIASVAWKTPRPATIGTRVAFVAHFLGRRLEYTYEIVAFEPGARLVMRTAEGPFPMETRYSFEALSLDRTRVTLHNRGQPSGFGRIAAPLMAAAMRRANRQDLARLKEILELGA